MDEWNTYLLHTPGISKEKKEEKTLMNNRGMMGNIGSPNALAWDDQESQMRNEPIQAQLISLCSCKKLLSPTEGDLP